MRTIDLPKLDLTKLDLSKLPKPDLSKLDLSKLDLSKLPKPDLSKLDTSKLPRPDLSKLPRFDVSRLDPRQVDMPTIDMPTIDMPKIDIDWSALGLADIDEKVAGIVKDAVYISIGFGVLAVQKTQVRRRELVSQLSERLGSTREQVEELLAGVEKQVRSRTGRGTAA